MNKDEKLFLLLYGERGPENEVPAAYAAFPLRRLLDRYKPRNLFEVSAAITVYDRYLEEAQFRGDGTEEDGLTFFQDIIDEPLETRFGAVEDLLAQSKGLLLWHHQLEALHACFDPDVQENIQFRKDINAKKASIVEYAEKLVFNNGTTLRTLIQERMRLNGVRRLDYRRMLAVLPYIGE